MHLKFIAILTIFILLFASVIVNSERINIRSSFKQDLIPSYTFHDNLKTLNENVTKLLAYAPKAFTENRGQLSNKDVRFYAQDGSVWFTNDGVWIDLREEAPIYNQQSIVHGLESRIKTDDWRPTTRDYKRIILKQEFIGANIVEPYGKNPMEFYSNFFYGNDSSKWKTKVPSYQEIYYENIYDNIDLKYYRSEAGLKYDFIMYPGADIYQIRIRFKGADGLDIDQFSDIIIKTSMGNIIDYDLFIYQDYDDSRHSIEGSFKILNNLEYGFELSGDYNPLEVLVIDPTVELEYSTFLGAESYCVAITVDNNGSAIVTGSTQSSTFPTTPGAYDTSFNDPQGWWDIFVTKFNPNGSALIFSTYIGGSNGNYLDWAHDIAMDADGNVFLTGETYCLDYPTTKGAFNTSKTSKKGSAFVTKLNADGTKLIYSTFIHGTSIREDCGNSIVVDTFGNAFVTGYTYSSDFPTTPGAYDTSFDVGTDVFILKLNPSGTALNYSTFIGGTSIDSGIGIVIDDIGNAYVTGGTSSSDFPTTDGAYDTSHNDNYDGFILKLDQNGSSLIFSTVIGGNDDDGCGDIALNKNGNIIVVGDTQSLNFPTTNNAIDKTFNGGSYDIFIAILNKTGASLNYSTYLGGNNTETTYNIVVNSFGEIYITGFTNSSNFPTTYDAFNNSYMNSNMFLAQLNQNGSELMYSTFIYGGRGFGEGIAIDDFNNVYIGGNTGASDFPTTPGAYDTTFNGASTYGNVFVMKWFRNNIHSINSVSLKRDSLQVSKVYSKVGSYTFNVNLINTISSIDLKRVGIILFPHGNNIKLQWDRSTCLFSKLNDPNNYVTLEPSSKIYNDYWDKWSIDFNVTFNWTYPDEALQDVQAYVTSATISPALFNATEMFSVENDLIFNGTLSVKGEDNRVLKENDLVRGNEVLTWTGLRVIYEGTIDLFPPEEEYNITIWDESGDLWEVSPGLGEFFILQTLTTPHTDLDGDKHIINISGIPSECDGTNTSLILKIDNDNVTFTYATPNNETWHRDSTVDVGINISDIGGGYVDGTKVMYTVSTNNGTTWNDWILAPSMTSATTIRVKTVSDF